MTLRLVIGIDPGLNGSIALMADGEPSTVYDMPTCETVNGSREVDPWAVAKLIDGIVVAYIGTHVHVVLEAPAMRPGNARGNDTKAAQGVGILKGVLASHGVQWTVVQPQAWKRWQGLIGKGKDDSRMLATMKWPRHGLLFQRVKDDGRAEAMLMAQWGAATECWITKPSERKKRVARKKPKASHSAELL